MNAMTGRREAFPDFLAIVAKAARIPHLAKLLVSFFPG